MSRLCERPGCSDVAAVAYGMRTEDLVFWLDVLVDGADPVAGALCRRHGDGMVVPRGWTLDDLRDPDLHLFRPPPVEARERQPGPRRRTATPTGQLALAGVDPGSDRAASPVTPEAAADPLPTPPGASTDAASVDEAPTVPDSAGGDVSWRPTFDADDDLDGLLAARSPLLSRAFRGTDRSG